MQQRAGKRADANLAASRGWGVHADGLTGHDDEHASREARRWAGVLAGAASPSARRAAKLLLLEGFGGREAPGPGAAASAG